MALGWRDIVATVATAGVMIITYAKVKGWSWPMLGSWRTATVVLLVLGLGACIVAGSGGTPAKDAWTVAASILGGLSFVLGVASLIFNSHMLFVALAINITALWAAATIRHIVQ